MLNISQILDDLKLRGFKNTKIREALIEILLKAKSPLDISETLEALAKKELTPNKTTIYREIIFLKEQGILEEIEFGEGKKRYEISETHHHHIKCVNCGEIKDVKENLKFENLKFFQQMGYKPIGHSLEFFGLCKNCQ
jgi:Fe2+ or Zn2+ uptake regulation protein